MDELAEKIKSQIADGSLFGEVVGSNDMNSMIVAAYFLGRADELKEKVEVFGRFIP